MPFYRPPPNDRSRIALGWFKEFQWSLNQTWFFLPLKGIYLRVTIPRMPRCGIMATQLLATLTIDYHLLKREIVVYLVNLRHPFLPPLLMCISCLNPRDGPMSHSVSCSIFEKIDPSRVSFFPPCHVDMISQSKTSREWWWSNQRSYEVQPGSWRLY